MLHSLIRMTLYMYLTYMQGFVNPKDTRKVNVLQNLFIREIFSKLNCLFY